MKVIVAMAQAPDSEQEKIAPKRRGRGIALGFISLLVLLALLVGGFVGYLALREEPFVLPEWARAHLEAQVNASAVPYEVKIGAASVVFSDGLTPSVALEDLRVSDAVGARLISFDGLSFTLAPEPLLRGQVQPVELRLGGARLGVRRDRSGQFWLSFDEALGGGGVQGVGFEQINDELDRLLAREELSSFERALISDLTVRYEDVRSQRRWIVDGGRLELTHESGALRARADLALLTGGAEAAGLELTLERAESSRESALAMNLSDFPARDLASQSAALSWLEALDAPISGALRVRLGAAGALGPLSATLQIGSGVLQPNAAATPVPFNSAKTYLTYDPETQIARFDEIELEGSLVSFDADGQLGLELNEAGWPESFIGQLHFGKITAYPKELLVEEARFDGGSADFRLSASPFKVDLGQLRLKSGETAFQIEGDVEALPEGWAYRVQAAAQDLSVQQVLGLWPEAAARKTRDWVAENVTGGRVSEAQFALRASPGMKPQPYVAFGFEDATLRFVEGMEPLRKLSGQASLLRGRFAVRAREGEIIAPQGGRLDAAGTEFVLANVMAKPVQADVAIEARGPLTALLSVLDQKPLNLISKAGQRVDVATGDMVASGRLGFPLKAKIPTEEIKYDVIGVVRNARSSTVVPGRVLTSPKLDVTAGQAGLKISGGGKLDAIPVSGTFTAPLGAGGRGVSKVSGTVEISPRFVSSFNLGLPRNSVSGRGTAKIDLTLRSGRGPDFALSSNLAGVGLAIPEIGWRKSKGSKGTLRVSGALGDSLRVDKIALRAAGLKADGKVTLDSKQRFKEARFDRVTIGSWVDVPLKIVSRGQGRAPRLEINGGRLDLTQTSLGAGSSGGSAGGQGGSPIVARLDRLKISQGLELTRFRGEFTTAKGFNGNFSGRVNGTAPVSGRIVPQKGRSAFRIQSQNGGQVLKAAGLLKNASGGSFDLTLAPATAKGSYNGSLAMEGVRLKDAPVMAELLNAISVVGLLEQLGGSGILFNEVEVRFQLTPSQLILTKSSAVGTSMGISMDGYYNLASGRLSMQGVFSPLYLLNGIGQIFTRKGEGLLGFNYKIYGPAAKPKVLVNPLSIFTPGMFREIFRRPVPKVQK